MHRSFKDNSKAFLLCILLIILVRLFNTGAWWIFLIPVLFLGLFISYRRWKVKSFGAGFLAGFITWFGMNVFYDQLYEGTLFAKLASTISMPAIVLFLLSGIVGGLLTGLALYTGSSILTYTEPTRRSAC